MNTELWGGLITGIIFGILMQRSEVIRYDRQVGAVRLIDMTIIKFMLSAILVGTVGIYQLRELGMIALSVKGTVVGNNVVGGLIFGAGWALLGYCPGTAAGALGEGRLDALIGMLGMLLGAIIFAEVYPYIQTGSLALGNYGKITLPDLLGADPWLLIVGVSVIYLLVLYIVEKLKL